MIKWLQSKMRKRVEKIPTVNESTEFERALTRVVQVLAGLCSTVTILNESISKFGEEARQVTIQADKWKFGLTQDGCDYGFEIKSPNCVYWVQTRLIWNSLPPMSQPPNLFDPDYIERSLLKITSSWQELQVFFEDPDVEKHLLELAEFERSTMVMEGIPGQNIELSIWTSAPIERW